MIKEKLRDLGRTIIGQGPEVRFKNDAEKYAKDNSITIDEAKKVLFDNAMADAENEVIYKGCINFDSKEYRRFQAALNEIFSFTELSKFRADASTSVFKPLVPPSIPPTPAEYKKIENYYNGKFDKKHPSSPEITKTAENTKGINRLFQRLSIDPNLLSATNLNILMATHPELGADLGKIMGLKDQIEKIEQKFEKGVDSDKANEKLVSDLKELLGKKMWKGTYDWLKIVTNSGLDPNFKSFSKAVGATGKLVFEGAWAGTKIGADIVKASALYVRKKIN